MHKSSESNLDKILSEEDYNHFLEIDKAREDYKNIRLKLDKLEETCNHKILPLTPKQKELLKEDDPESWDYDEAHCIICRSYFGWRCPDSPDGACHYYTNCDADSSKVGGPYYVVLINREEYIIENYEYSDAVNESDDWCIFCGAPQERK